MDKLALLELLLAGFFGVACLRARSPLKPGQTPGFGSFFRLSSRIERLKRSRWQWFSMVAIMLVLRVQNQLPPSLEVMALIMFVIFLAFPVQAMVRAGR